MSEKIREYCYKITYMYLSDVPVNLRHTNVPACVMYGTSTSLSAVRKECLDWIREYTRERFIILSLKRVPITEGEKAGMYFPIAKGGYPLGDQDWLTIQSYDQYQSDADKEPTPSPAVEEVVQTPIPLPSSTNEVVQTSILPLVGTASTSDVISETNSANSFSENRVQNIPSFIPQDGGDSFEKTTPEPKRFYNPMEWMYEKKAHVLSLFALAGVLDVLLGLLGAFLYLHFRRG